VHLTLPCRSMRGKLRRLKITSWQTSCDWNMTTALVSQTLICSARLMRIGRDRWVPVGCSPNLFIAWNIRCRNNNNSNNNISSSNSSRKNHNSISNNSNYNSSGYKHKNASAAVALNYYNENNEQSNMSRDGNNSWSNKSHINKDNSSKVKRTTTTITTTAETAMRATTAQPQHDQQRKKDNHLVFVSPLRNIFGLLFWDVFLKSIEVENCFAAVHWEQKFQITSCQGEIWYRKMNTKGKQTNRSSSGFRKSTATSTSYLKLLRKNPKLL